MSSSYGCTISKQCGTEEGRSKKAATQSRWYKYGCLSLILRASHYNASQILLIYLANRQVRQHPYLQRPMLAKLDNMRPHEAALLPPGRIAMADYFSLGRRPGILDRLMLLCTMAISITWTHTNLGRVWPKNYTSVSAPVMPSKVVLA